MIVIQFILEFTTKLFGQRVQVYFEIMKTLEVIHHNQPGMFEEN